MAMLIMINPASGDNSASLFTGTESTDEIMESIPKGTILKATGSKGNYYTVEYDNGDSNETKGGTLDSGTVVSYPYAPMYDDDRRTNQIANINTGTACNILDASKGFIIKIKVFSTEGWKEGYVDAKYIYRDTAEVVTPQVRSKVRSKVSPRANATSGVVVSSNGIKIRDKPSTSGKYIGAFGNNAKLTIHETKSGWYRVTGSGGSGTWGKTSNVWVSASYVRVTGSNSSAAVSKTDSTVVANSSSSASASTKYSAVQDHDVTSDGDDWLTYFTSGNSTSSKYTANDEYYKQLANKYTHALGTPPRYNMDIDIQYLDDLAPGAGRVTIKSLLTNPAILSICPGKVKMFPNLFGVEKDTAFASMINAAQGNAELLKKVQADEPGKFSGRLYKFEADTEEYAKYLNALCRGCAILLGIGDKMMPNTTTKLKHFDYAYYTIRKRYTPAAAGLSSAEANDTSLFRKFAPGLLKTATKVLSGAVDDTCYLNFFLNGSESQISDGVNTEVGESPLSGVVGTLSEAGANLNYFTGSGFDVGGDDVADAIDAVIGGGSGIVSGLKTVANNILKGGKIILPQMVKSCTYKKSVQVSMKFVSLYGDKYSVFLKCLIPICHLIALSYPRQVSDNMSMFPFLIRCTQNGHFNIDLGVIENIEITRGGSDETSWTADGIATEWDVTLQITPMVDELMITSTSHPVLMAKNEMLLDYLGNFCGFDPYANNLGVKLDLMSAFVYNKLGDIPHNLENRLSDAVYNLVNGIFKL